VLKVDSSLLNCLSLKQEKSEPKNPSVRRRAPSIYLPFASTSPETQQAWLNHCNISFSVERISYPLLFQHKDIIIYLLTTTQSFSRAVSWWNIPTGSVLRWCEERLRNHQTRRIGSKTKPRWRMWFYWHLEDQNRPTDDVAARLVFNGFHNRFAVFFLANKSKKDRRMFQSSVCSLPALSGW
jgi:hypothetical protein